jgi:hypothetical protein
MQQSDTWEEFAETWAHYFHILDTMEMAGAFGVRVSPRLHLSGTLSVNIAIDQYRGADVRQIIDDWLPLTFALNSINRCMGQPDPYPFIISPPVIEKLSFIHDLVYGSCQ